MLCLGLFEGVFDAAEVAFAIAVDDENLADGKADGFLRMRLRGTRQDAEQRSH